MKRIERILKSNDILITWCWIFLFAAVSILPFSQFPEDDALIHLRVAQHLVGGNAPFFNLSDPVATSSSPLWTLVLAALGYIAPLSPTTVAFLEVLVVTVATNLWSSMFRMIGGGHRLVTPLVVLGIILPSAVCLMETPLAIAFAGFTCRLLLAESWLALPYALLAAATRLELLPLVFITLWLCRRSRKHIVPAILFAGTLSGSLISYQWEQFHALLPQATHAKTVVYQVPPDVILTQLIINGLGLAPTLSILLVAVFALLLGGLRDFMHDAQRLTHCLVGLGMVIVVAWVVSGVPLFPWYPGIAWILLIPYVFVLSHHRNLVFRIPATIIITAFMVSACRIPIAHTFHLTQVLPWHESGARTRMYLALGHALQANCPQASIAAAEIGGLGYSFNGDIIDTAGLATSAAVRYHPLAIPDERDSPLIAGVPYRMIAAMQPDIVIAYPRFLKGVLNKPELMVQYTATNLPVFLPEDRMEFNYTSVFGNDHLILLNRIDATRCPQDRLKSIVSTFITAPQ